ncbi:MAG: hypothetical protein ACYC3A_10240 [Halothiobacillus sp.]
MTDTQKAAANQVLVAGLDQTLQYSAPVDEPIIFADTRKHGIMVFSVTQTQTTVDYLLIDQSYVATDLTNNPAVLTKQFTQKSFTLNPQTGAVTPIGA